MNLADNSYHTETDRELLEKYRKSRNNDWLGILLERYLHLIFGVCMKYLENEEEAKDHTQQICLQVLKNIPRHEVTYFKSWLYQVAKNHCLMHLRKSRHLYTQPLTEDRLTEIHIEPEAVEAGEKEIQLNYLDQAMKLLNEPQHTCLDMFFFQKKSYQYISEVTGYSMKQVKSHIQNGKRNLKQAMERLADNDRANNDRGKIKH